MNALIYFLDEFICINSKWAVEFFAILQRYPRSKSVSYSS